MKIAVIGAGPMGLAAAYEAARAGASVVVFERDDRVGGMSASMDFDGTRIERYYHFICTPDACLFRYLREFGLMHKLRWTETKMGFYFQGTLYDWGHPFALLKFPALSFAEKVRYGLHVMYAKSIRDWRPFDGFSSTQWLKRWIGEHAYDVLWRSLFHYKFYEFEDQLAAAWLGTRIQRVALSRKSIIQEKLGYLEGGSEVLLEAVTRHIQELDGKIELKAAVEEVVVEEASGAQKVRGLRVAGVEREFDRVISTIPLPYLTRLIPRLPEAERSMIAAIRNVGVVCAVLKLRRPYTRNFWMNINDPRIELPGLIEYSNLNPMPAAIVYAPYYMPQTHPKYSRRPEDFVNETVSYMKLMRPDWDAADVIAATASRYEFAQTVCTPGFFSALPPKKSRIEGLIMADTSHYYPEDRSISESMRIGAELAGLAMAGRTAS